jgi:hypothetical protein
MELPSHTLYADLKNFGRISHRDAALILMRPDARYGELTIRGRALSDRTFLSREIVHAKPGQYGRESFQDFPTSVRELWTLLLERHGGGEAGCHALLAHYTGSAAEKMRRAVAETGGDANLYANTIQKLSVEPGLTDERRAQLSLMLFVVTGCLGSPGPAIAIVDDFATEAFSLGLGTIETSVGPGFAHAVAPKPRGVRLGLLRIQDGVAQPPVQTLSVAPEGTVIGALATGPGAITNVDIDVSREHLRIYRREGAWWAQGLGSTNGTTLISGDTRQVSVVEPPRAERKPGHTYGPVRINNSDTLCLGATTRFLVLRIAGPHAQLNPKGNQ